MYSKLPFPLSMENIPRQRGFFCVSLKTTTITTAILVICLTLYGMAQGVQLLVIMLDHQSALVLTGLSTSILVGKIVANIVTFFLSLMLLLGTFKGRLQLMKPWIVWFSVKMIASVLIFIYIIALNTINSFTTEPSVLLFYVAHLFKLLVQVCMLVLVSSYYRQLEEGYAGTERQEHGHIHSNFYQNIC